MNKRIIDLAILSRFPQAYSTARLLAAASAAGVQTLMFDAARLSLLFDNRGPLVAGESGILPAPRAVIPRLGVSLLGRGLRLLRHLELAGARSLNEAAAISLAADKFGLLRALAGRGVAVPRTVLIMTAGAARDALEILGGPPVVLKPPRGSRGNGVLLARGRTQATELSALLCRLHGAAMVQKYYREAGRSDWRILVVGSAATAGYRRVAPKGEFRANLHQGGRALGEKPPDAVFKLAERACRAVRGLGFAGVDVIETAHGPLVLEINHTPGLRGIERVTGVDVAALAVAQALKLISNDRTGTEVAAEEIRGSWLSERQPSPSG